MAQSSTKKWLKGCGIGCAVVFVLFILSLVGGSVFLLRPFRDAIETREELDEAYGDQAAYTPPADGAIGPARLEAFLGVRQALMALCPEFETTAHQFEQIDDLQQDTSKKEVLSTFFELSKEMFGMGPRMGRFFEVRNQALLDAGMGRGEYTYIYLVAYRDRFFSPTRDFAGAQRSRYGPNRRVRGVLAQMLNNQLEAADARLAVENDPELAVFRDSLAEEISRLEGDPEAWPWQEGLPTTVSASLSPYRAQLDPLFCEYTLDLEFTQNQKRFLGIQGD